MTLKDFVEGLNALLPYFTNPQRNKEVDVIDKYPEMREPTEYECSSKSKVWSDPATGDVGYAMWYSAGGFAVKCVVVIPVIGSFNVLIWNGERFCVFKQNNDRKPVLIHN